jgi:hypothetical protein
MVLVAHPCLTGERDVKAGQSRRLELLSWEADPGNWAGNTCRDDGLGYGGRLDNESGLFPILQLPDGLFHSPQTPRGN